MEFSQPVSNRGGQCPVWGQKQLGQRYCVAVSPTHTGDFWRFCIDNNATSYDICCGGGCTQCRDNNGIIVSNADGRHSHTT